MENIFKLVGKRKVSAQDHLRLRDIPENKQEVSQVADQRDVLHRSEKGNKRTSAER